VPSQDQLDLIRFLEAHKIKPVLDRAFKMEDLAEGFAYLRSGTHFGKIVIDL
jgi:NADPH:quinone reductase-like Zn-dependent oxidoreductase